MHPNTANEEKTRTLIWRSHDTVHFV